MKNLLPKAHSPHYKRNFLAYFAVILAWAALFLIVGLLCGRFSVSTPAISLLPQAAHVEPPDERLAAAQNENPDTVA
mgnify:FL=1